MSDPLAPEDLQAMVRRLTGVLKGKWVARQLGLHESTISNYRSGWKKNMPPATQQKLIELWTRCKQAGLI